MTYQKSMRCIKSFSRREFHSNIDLPQEIKSEVNNLTSHLEELEEEQMKPQINRRKKIIKTREKINREKNGKDQ